MKPLVLEKKIIHARCSAEMPHAKCGLVAVECDLEPDNRRAGWVCKGAVLRFCLTHQVIVLRCTRCRGWAEIQLQDNRKSDIV